MVRILLPIFLMLVSVLPAAAQPTSRDERNPVAAFDGAVDFSVTLREMNRQLQPDSVSTLRSDTLYILDGLVSGISVVDRDPEQFLAIVELVNGAWIGLERIETYRAWLRCSGPNFAGRFPERASREPDPEAVALNAHLLVVVRIADVVEEDDGTLVPVLEVVHARTIQ